MTAVSSHPPLHTPSQRPGALDPQRARHRAPRTESRARRIVARISAAGATLALPVVGASMANASDGGGDTYSVQSGDTLSGIAEQQHIEGGWQKLYEANERTIGGDPDTLPAGARLTLETGDTRDAVRPVEGGQVTAGYQSSGSHWSHGHTGVDIAVPDGTEVKAALGGEIVTAGWDDAFGNQIVIAHADGTYSHYAHLSELDVQRGEQVDVGERIARSGSTGNSTGPHLHFEVRTTPEYGSAVDPVAWLKGRGITL